MGLGKMKKSAQNARTVVEKIEICEISEETVCVHPICAALALN